jgi:hypothetical protein
MEEGVNFAMAMSGVENTMAAICGHLASNRRKGMTAAMLEASKTLEKPIILAATDQERRALLHQGPHLDPGNVLILWGLERYLRGREGALLIDNGALYQLCQMGYQRIRILETNLALRGPWEANGWESTLEVERARRVAAETERDELRALIEECLAAPDP